MSDDSELELSGRARRRLDELVGIVQDPVCRQLHLMLPPKRVSWEALGPDALRLVSQRALEECRESVRLDRFSDAKDYVAVADFIDDVLANRLMEAVRMPVHPDAGRGGTGSTAG